MRCIFVYVRLLDRGRTAGSLLRPSAVWSESDAQKRRESVWASLSTLQPVVPSTSDATKIGSEACIGTAAQIIN